MSLDTSIPYSGTTEVSDIEPARVMEIDIGQSLPTLSSLDTRTGQHYQRTLCVIRLHTQPLGVVELQHGTGEMDTDIVAQHIWNALSTNINEHLRQDGLPTVDKLDANGLSCVGIPDCIEQREQFLAHAPFVSVIVPTHNRPELMQACLRSLVALKYPHYEVIVVDNAPQTNATAEFMQRVYGDMQWIRYLREERPGVSWARNCGIRAARGEILAFTDDDVVVDPYWLVELVRAFSLASNVACITGQILPLELETPAQFWYEQYGGMDWFQEPGKTCMWSTRRIFDLAENRPKMHLYPYRAGQFGCGASMACTATFLHSINGFDPALGGNGPSRCAQDIAVLFQAIIHGHKLVYEPASLVYHLNRRTYSALKQQIYNYGIGMTAYLTKSLLENPWLLFDFVPKLLYMLFSSLAKRGPRGKKLLPSYPQELTRLNRQGMLYGPFAYIQSWWIARKVRKSFDTSQSTTYLYKKKAQHREKAIDKVD